MKTMLENRYRVVSIIRSNDQGTLFRALDEKRGGKKVALQTVQGSRDFVRSLKGMAGITNAFSFLKVLRHPYLLPITDFGVTKEEILFYTMALRDGIFLNPEKGAHPPEFVIGLMLEICHTLGFLHHQGIIHGNLTPYNLLLVKDHIQLFGLGTVLLKDGDEKIPAQLVTEYTAPEFKSIHALSPQCDLYSLGAIGFTLMTGNSLPKNFSQTGGNRSELKAALENTPEILPSTRDVILCLLSENPSHRYESARKTALALYESIGEKDLTSIHRRRFLQNKEIPLLRADFLGRDDEIRTLGQMSDTSGTHVGIITGGDGYGKTRQIGRAHV